MKQFTNNAETKELKTLGFALPLSISDHEYDPEMGRTTILKNYSIGELLEIITMASNKCNKEFNVWKDDTFWYVKFSDLGIYHNTELVDALFDCCVNLKKNNII
jgi:hypothetical protein